METEEEDDEIPSEFISRKDLEKNRLSREGKTVRIDYLVTAFWFVVTNSLNKCFFNWAYSELFYIEQMCKSKWTKAWFIFFCLQEMEKYSVFKNYEPGDPNCRIYVKNLAKQVQEKVSKQAN